MNIGSVQIALQYMITKQLIITLLINRREKKMKQNTVYILLIIVCAGVFLFVSLYINSFVTPGPNAAYIIKNILQISSLIMAGVLSTLLHKKRKNEN